MCFIQTSAVGRGAFEAWRLSCAPGLDMSRNMPDGSYNNPRTHDQWQAWCACLALAQAERAAASKMVD